MSANFTAHNVRSHVSKFTNSKYHSFDKLEKIVTDSLFRYLKLENFLHRDCNLKLQGKLSHLDDHEIGPILTGQILMLINSSTHLMND